MKMAKELEKRGSHILGIKDMSGLLKPMAAYKLIDALKQEIGIPIHLHTHDTSGNGVATILMAAQRGSGCCGRRVQQHVRTDQPAGAELRSRGS